MFVKHVYPPSLKLKCDLDLWPRNPKFNRSHLLIMTNHYPKLEDPWAMSSLVIDRTMFVYGPTDMCSEQLYSHFFEGGHNKYLNYINACIQSVHTIHHNTLSPIYQTSDMRQYPLHYNIIINTHIWLINITYCCYKSL